MKDKNPPPGACDWVPADGREAGSGASCDWAAGPAARQECRSTFRSFAAYGWEGIEPERYKAETGGWTAIARQVLTAGPAGAGFDLRYFEIAPGGHSSLEAHRHAHVVVGIRGRGQVLVGGEIREVRFLDLVYLAPDDPHQLLNPYGEPFGFFCIVDHDRDRPRPLREDELAEVRQSAGDKIKY